MVTLRQVAQGQMNTTQKLNSKLHAVSQERLTDHGKTTFRPPLPVEINGRRKQGSRQARQAAKAGKPGTLQMAELTVLG